MSDREKQREAYNEAYYETWRRGLNPDRINEDRLQGYLYDSGDPHEAASRECRQIQRQDMERRELREREEYEQQQDDYYRQQEAEHYQQIEDERASEEPPHG